MSTIIRTRSPFFIRTPDITDPTDLANLSYFQIVITIHGGLTGSTTICDDLYAQFTLKKKPLPSEPSVSFEISEIVNDHLIQTFNGTYATSARTQSIWVDVSTTAREADGTIIGSATNTTYLAQEGFNKFKEGVNYTTEPIAMISADYLEYHKGSYITLPINGERVSRLTWKLNGSTVTTVNYTDNGNQNQKVKYGTVNTAAQSYDEVVVTYDTTQNKSITLKEISECKYEVFKVTFLNRWGALQDIFFFKKSTESLDTRSEQFNRSIFKARDVSLEPPEEGDDCVETITYNSYSTTAHAKKTFNVNGTESITLNSGFVSETGNVFFEELMVSENIWLTDGDAVVYPVNLKDSNFVYKTGLNDRMINYTMNFEMAFDLVNNIR